VEVEDLVNAAVILSRVPDNPQGAAEHTSHRSGGVPKTDTRQAELDLRQAIGVIVLRSQARRRSRGEKCAEAEVK
jgi:hypothetical protein